MTDRGNLLLYYTHSIHIVQANGVRPYHLNIIHRPVKIQKAVNGER